jgi:hypothetical protein
MIPLMILGMIHFPAWSDQGEEARAEMHLEQLAKKLAGAKQFSFTMHIDYDVMQASGQKVQFSEVREVKVSRPDRIRVDTRQSDGDTGGLIFDGKDFTLFSTSANVYSKVNRPSNLDEAIRHAVGKLGVRVPLARMLLSSLPQEMKRLNRKVDYVEQNTLGSTPSDHIAVQANNVDYQIWIAQDMLPRRVVITYKNEPGQPQFQADLTDWNMSPQISSSSFTFVPPKGAEKIRTLLPAVRADEISKAEEGK